MMLFALMEFLRIVPQIWARSCKPFLHSHAEVGTGASWSGMLCFR
jgi:hypothetical protein